MVEDSPAPPEDEADDEYSEGATRKPLKRISTSSRGRGRRSLPPREIKEESSELDTSLLNSSTVSRGSMSKRKTGRKRRDRKSSPSLLEIDPPDPDEPRYCSCNEVSYGDMIGCDNNNCPIEWFHFRCVNLTAKPKGKWYCPTCTQDKKKNS